MIPMLSLPQRIFTLLNTSSQAPILDDPDYPVTTTVKRVKKQIPPLPEAGGHSYFGNRWLRYVSCLVHDTDDNPTSETSSEPLKSEEKRHHTT